MTTALVGQKAPVFDLESTSSSPEGVTSRARLDDFRGQWLIVVFYPRDFSLVCPTELISLSDRFDDFESQGARIIGISTDSIVSHTRWINLPRNQGGVSGLRFPLASDDSGEISRAFGVYQEANNAALRGLFIIDPNGVIQYQVVHNMSVGRRADEILRVLSAIQTGGLCGENWTQEAPAMIDPTQELGPGRVISHYRIEDVIGSGTFSTVYRAHDLTLDRDVALKIFKNTDTSRNRLALNEARAAASLNHINIGTIFAVDDAEGVSMIAMEYLKGKTLADYVAQGAQSVEWVARITHQVAKGVGAAHSRGLVHGDLKPANIIVADNGLVKILDFGLSRRENAANPFAIDPDATVDRSEFEPSGISGTPSYLSPEQAAGENASTQSDVFALGAIVYELLTGRKAFPGKNLLQVLNEIARVDPDKLGGEVPAPFDDLIRCALAVDPEERGLCMHEISNLFPGAICPLEAAEV